MNLTVFGPTDPTGAQIVRRALAAGHEAACGPRRRAGSCVPKRRCTRRARRTCSPPCATRACAGSSGRTTGRARSTVTSCFPCCAAAGIQPRVAFEAGDPNVLARLAGRGLGVAILPESLADYYKAELHAIAITGPVLRGSVDLAWRAEGPVNPAARALIERACNVLGDPPADR